MALIGAPAKGLVLAGLAMPRSKGLEAGAGCRGDGKQRLLAGCGLSGGGEWSGSGKRSRTDRRFVRG